MSSTLAVLCTQLEREQFDEHATSGSPTDAYAVARELGYRKGWNDRTLACLRELRSALVIETRPLFEAMHVEGEWEP